MYDAPEILEGASLRLILDTYTPADDVRGLVPYYHYRLQTMHAVDMGHLNFRIGDTAHILNVAGHIGYWVAPEFRGQSASYKACLLLAPFIRSIYPSVIITSDPDNAASIAIIEKLGADFIDEIRIPPGDPAYKNTPQYKRRYRWHA